MGFNLYNIFIVASVLTFLFVIMRIRKHGLNIDDSIVWILWSLLLLVISLFPNLPTMISDFLGFMSPSNFIFCVFIFFLYIVLFFQNIQISKLKEKQKELIQKLSLKEVEEREKEN